MQSFLHSLGLDHLYELFDREQVLKWVDYEGGFPNDKNCDFEGEQQQQQTTN